jgi:hypothetical protein
MLAHNRRIRIRRVCDGTSLEAAPVRPLFSGDDIDGMLDAVGSSPDLHDALESGYQRIAQVSGPDEPPTTRLAAVPEAETAVAFDDIEELTEGITEGWED